MKHPRAELKFLIAKTENIYYKQNQKLFDELLELVMHNQASYSRKLNANGRKRELGVIPPYKHLKQWIDDCLPLLKDPFYNMPTKVYWILNGLVSFPICPSCHSDENFKKKNVGLFGYRICCCIQCLGKYEKHRQKQMATAKRHSEEDPLYYQKIAAKSISTKFAKNGGKYFSDKSIQQMKDTFAQLVEENPNFWIDRDQKTKATKVANGYDPNWNNSQQIAETRLKNNNGVWETEEQKRQKAETSIKKYGFKSPNSSPVVKQHKKESCLKKFGKEVFFQTDEFKDYMKQINEIRKQKELATKRKNKSFRISKPEEEAYYWLLFAFPQLQRQYTSLEYPFVADFFDPRQPFVRFEFQGSWTHGKHPFNPNSTADIAVVNKWKERRTKYYQNAIDTWTRRDPIKRKTAQENGITLIEFWSLEEVRVFVFETLMKVAFQKCISEE